MTKFEQVGRGRAQRRPGTSAQYVDPRLDGARLGVTGYGQRERIDEKHCGEEAFFGFQE